MNRTLTTDEDVIVDAIDDDEDLEDEDLEDEEMEDEEDDDSDDNDNY